jgi:hypothetical protein
MVMKKCFYLILVFLLPFFCNAQNLFRSGTFLHHSTGGNIWGPNGSSTSIPQQIAIYNTNHGYTGSNEVSMSEQWWPQGDNNEWGYWHQIFDNQISNANIQLIMANNKIVVVKSCYPSSDMTGPGQASDTLNYSIKSDYNYKWHWRFMINFMVQHPENFFVIWTNAPLVAGATNASSALYSKSFCAWAKNTLAQGLDPMTGDFPPNIFVFDYFSKLTDANGYELLQYAVSNYDSHPNATATALVAPQFVNEIFDAAIAYEQGSETINVTPASQSTGNSSGNTSFEVTYYTSWTASSNSGWCTVSPSGNGNGEIIATFTENLAEARVVNITVSANGVPSVIVTLSQDGASSKTLNLSVLIEGLYAGGGTMNQANDETGPHFGPGIADLATVELHNAGDYGIIEYSATGIELLTSGIAMVDIPSEYSGNYYITVKHRNSIETTSAIPVSFEPTDISFAFNLPSKVYNGNLLLSDGFYVIYSGDVNQDGSIDTADLTMADNDIAGYISGYLATDVNSDGIIDTADMTIIDNNSSAFISAATP